MFRRSKTGPPAASGQCLFLSPEWIHEVAAAVRRALGSDLYFRNLASMFTLRFACLVRDLPPELRQAYGAEVAVIVVNLQGGNVRKVEIRDEVPRDNIDLVITSDYRVAKGILLGRLSAPGSFLSGKVRVQPVNGLRRQLSIAKSLVTASEVVKIARQVPAAF